MAFCWSKNLFEFVDFETQFKINLSFVAKMYLVCGLLQNDSMVKKSATILN